MLIPYQALTSKNTYVSMNTRTGTSEIEVGGIMSGSYAPTAAETQEVSVTRGPDYQDTGRPGPGNMPLQVFFSPGTEAARELAKKHLSGDSQIFSIYLGQQEDIYDATASGVAAAKIAITTAAGKTTGTLTGGMPNWGDAEDYGTLAVGHIVEVDAALWEILGIEDQNYNQASKLRLRPIDGAADVGTASDYRIYGAIFINENWLGNVIDMSGFSFDASSPVMTSNVTIAPKIILSATQYKPLAWV